MPYIVVKFNEQEVDRRELTDELVIGRAPECGLAIRDILLSRRHCQLDEGPTGWLITDLNSKNGTYINGERLNGQRLLQDTDSVRMGRSRVTFFAGLPDESVEERLMAPARPRDPGDSMSGTLTGFTLLMPGEGETPQNMPCPRPTPKQPAAYESPEIQALLTSLASSSWDSIYAQARQPTRQLSQSAGLEEPNVRPMRPAMPMRGRSPTDLSLQANTASLAAESEPAPTPRPVRSVRTPRWPRMPRLVRSNHNWRVRYRRELPLLAGGVWGLALILFVHNLPLFFGTARPARPSLDDSAIVASAKEPPLLGHRAVSEPAATPSIAPPIAPAAAHTPVSVALPIADSAPAVSLSRYLNSKPDLCLPINPAKMIDSPAHPDTDSQPHPSIVDIK